MLGKSSFDRGRAIEPNHSRIPANKSYWLSSIGPAGLCPEKGKKIDPESTPPYIVHTYVRST